MSLLITFCLVDPDSIPDLKPPPKLEKMLLTEGAPYIDAVGTVLIYSQTNAPGAFDPDLQAGIECGFIRQGNCSNSEIPDCGRCRDTQSSGRRWYVIVVFISACLILLTTVGRK